MIAAVIPTHNRREALLKCLEDVLSSSQCEIIPIVVCDGCTDDSQSEARKLSSRIEIVEGDGSLWWTGAINAGLERALSLDAKCIVFLNDDIRIPSGTLEVLSRSALSQPEAIFGPVILQVDRPDLIWAAGGLVHWAGRGLYSRGAGQRFEGRWRTAEQVQWLPGMGMTFSTSVLNRTGFPDAATFPQYFGDADFSLRASAQGIPVIVQPEAVLFNDVASTGVLLPPGPVRLSQALATLLSRRSHANVIDRTRFLVRHCHPLFVPWQLTRFYVPLVATILKKLIVG